MYEWRHGLMPLKQCAAVRAQPSVTKYITIFKFSIWKHCKRATQEQTQTVNRESNYRRTVCWVGITRLSASISKTLSYSVLYVFWELISGIDERRLSFTLVTQYVRFFEKIKLRFYTFVKMFDDYYSGCTLLKPIADKAGIEIDRVSLSRLITGISNGGKNSTWTYSHFHGW